MRHLHNRLRNQYFRINLVQIQQVIIEIDSSKNKIDIHSQPKSLITLHTPFLMIHKYSVERKDQEEISEDINVIY